MDITDRRTSTTKDGDTTEAGKGLSDVYHLSRGVQGPSHVTLRSRVLYNVHHIVHTDTATSYRLKTIVCPRPYGNEFISVQRSIPCPHCRRLTNVPDPSKPVEEWAGQLHTGFLIRGLVEAVVTEGEHCHECAPCLEDGENITAVFWCKKCKHGLCSGCEKFHRKMPLTKNHEAILLTEDNRSSVTKSSESFNCSKHPDSVTDMMCEDHDAVICHRCCMLHHRKCDSVIMLDECVPRLKAVVHAHCTVLEAVETEIKKNISLKKSAVADVEEEAVNAVSSIDVSCQKVIDEVRKQATQLTQKVKQVKDKHLQDLQRYIKIEEKKLEETQQKLSLLTEGINAFVPVKWYQLYKLCKYLSVTHNKDSVTNQLKVQIEVSDNSDEIISYIGDKSVAKVKILANTPHAAGSSSDANNDLPLVRSLSTSDFAIGGAMSQFDLDEPLPKSDSSSPVCPPNSPSPPTNTDSSPDTSQCSSLSSHSSSQSRSNTPAGRYQPSSSLPADGSRSRPITPSDGSSSKSKSSSARKASKSTLFQKLESGLQSLSDGTWH